MDSLSFIQPTLTFVEMRTPRTFTHLWHAARLLTVCPPALVWQQPALLHQWQLQVPAAFPVSMSSPPSCDTPGLAVSTNCASPPRAPADGTSAGYSA